MAMMQKRREEDTPAVAIGLEAAQKKALELAEAFSKANTSAQTATVLQEMANYLKNDIAKLSGQEKMKIFSDVKFTNLFSKANEKISNLEHANDHSLHGSFYGASLSLMNDVFSDMYAQKIATFDTKSLEGLVKSAAACIDSLQVSVYKLHKEGKIGKSDLEELVSGSDVALLAKNAVLPIIRNEATGINDSETAKLLGNISQLKDACGMPNIDLELGDIERIYKERITDSGNSARMRVAYIKLMFAADAFVSDKEYVAKKTADFFESIKSETVEGSNLVQKAWSNQAYKAWSAQLVINGYADLAFDELEASVGKMLDYKKPGTGTEAHLTYVGTLWQIIKDGEEDKKEVAASVLIRYGNRLYDEMEPGQKDNRDVGMLLKSLRDAIESIETSRGMALKTPPLYREGITYKTLAEDLRTRFEQISGEDHSVQSNISGDWTAFDLGTTPIRTEPTVLNKTTPDVFRQLESPFNILGTPLFGFYNSNDPADVKKIENIADEIKKVQGNLMAYIKSKDLGLSPSEISIGLGGLINSLNTKTSKTDNLLKALTESPSHPEGVSIGEINAILRKHGDSPQAWKLLFGYTIEDIKNNTWRNAQGGLFSGSTLAKNVVPNILKEGGFGIKIKEVESVQSVKFSAGSLEAARQYSEAVKNGKAYQAGLFAPLYMITATYETGTKDYVIMTENEIIERIKSPDNIERLGLEYSMLSPAGVVQLGAILENDKASWKIGLETYRPVGLKIGELDLGLTGISSELFGNSAFVTVGLGAKYKAIKFEYKSTYEASGEKKHLGSQFSLQEQVGSVMFMQSAGVGRDKEVSLNVGAYYTLNENLMLGLLATTATRTDMPSDWKIRNLDKVTLDLRWMLFK
ncbi:hypothetical protein FJZ26_01420 [Candidatus Parvarchaeota archaeon]|nr:hypothetical protein [Candidatus Parvarchaeota archaeon]